MASTESGIPRVEIIEEHASAYYYPFSVFERFWLPYTEQMINTLAERGIFTVMHLDMKWDRNLLYFRSLPSGTVAIQLDGTTDIFEAKKIVGDRIALLGDVPATMLTIEGPEAVSRYCERLIDEVGADGGFILKNACVLPLNFRSECFAAMIDTAKRYELSK
jgi:uroporphyrinogen-III decarboxylase